jgi:hypothetical protein
VHFDYVFQILVAVSLLFLPLLPVMLVLSGYDTTCILVDLSCRCRGLNTTFPSLGYICLAFPYIINSFVLQEAEIAINEMTGKADILCLSPGR